MAVLRMSTEELSRVETLVQVVSGRLTVTEAAQIMGITRRHAHRLLIRFMDDGSSGLISRRRGRPSNRRMDDAVRNQIVALVREHYHDFGPTLAAEYLTERHDVRTSRETLRKRSEEHTSELQSLMRNSYAVFCLKKKTCHIHNNKI